MCACSVCVGLFATPWTAAHQAPLSMRFPRQEYLNGLPLLSPGDLLTLGIKPGSPALAGRFFTTEPPEKITCWRSVCIINHHRLTSRYSVISFSSVRSLNPVWLSDSLWPHESQHARPACPSLTPRVYSNPCPLSWWCHTAISSSVVPFSFCPRYLPAWGSFPMSQLFAWGGQSTGASASASVLPMNTQAWSPLGGTGWISLQSKGLSRVFSNTTVQKHQFFGAQLSSQSNSHTHISNTINLANFQGINAPSINVGCVQRRSWKIRFGVPWMFGRKLSLACAGGDFTRLGRYQHLGLRAVRRFRKPHRLERKSQPEREPSLNRLEDQQKPRAASP